MGTTNVKLPANNVISCKTKSTYLPSNVKLTVFGIGKSVVCLTHALSDKTPDLINHDVRCLHLLIISSCVISSVVRKSTLSG